MKTFYLIFTVLCAAVMARADGIAPVVEESSYAIVARDRDSRTWEKTIHVTVGENEKWMTNRVVEMATGLHYFSGGQWQETQEAFTILQNGSGEATNGNHQAYIAANINSAVSATIVTPDSKTLQTRIMGLAYFDFSKQQSVLLAELQNSTGALVESNRVLYSDAFDGGFQADVLFTYTRDGWEQDIIFRERPPLPESFNLDPRTTWLEVWTEFIDPPEVVKDQRVRKGWLVSKVDKILDFGVMKIPEGQAFGMDALPDKGAGFPVRKHWTVDGERTFLIEEAPFRLCAHKLALLPEAPQASRTKHKNPKIQQVAKTRVWPARKVAAMESKARIQAALGTMRNKGFYIDWSSVASGSDFTFKSDTTYFANGTINLSGVTTIEGGTVVKSTNNTTINILGTVNCLASSYRPAIFTHCKDASVGDSIYVGSPTLATNSIILSLANGGDLHNLHFRYAGTAIKSEEDFSITHSQFINCSNAFHIEQSSFYAGNILAVNVTNIFYGRQFHGTNEHLTAHHVHRTVEDYTYDPPSCYGLDSPSSLLLVNSLLMETQYGEFSPDEDHVVKSMYDLPDIFQSVGGAGHYLISQSPYRNYGTTNIRPALLAALAKKTTYPPLVYSNTVFSVETTFDPQAQRDFDDLDIGYHYDPLDYAFGGTHASNNLVFAPGTAAGWFRTSSDWYHAGQGIHLADTRIATFNGRADALDYWVRCNMSQEESTGLWEGGYGPGGITCWADQYAGHPEWAGEARLRFTHGSMSGGEPGGHFRDDYGYLVVRAQDCEFTGGWMGTYVSSSFFTNCLMDRVGNYQIEGWPGNEIHFRNCTFHGGILNISRSHTSIPVTVKDCAFDGTYFDVKDSIYSNPTYTTFDYNAFLTNTTAATPTNAHDVLITNFNWQASYFGNFYISTNSALTNAGSRYATNAGLFHYTMITNQVKEASTLVDIGYHYLSATNGVISDMDGDGLLDYLEDANGNGAIDSGETDWNNVADYLGLKVWITRPRSNSNLP